MSDGSPFAGSLLVSSGLLPLTTNGSNIVLAADLQAGDEGTSSSYTVTATQNGAQAQSPSFEIDVVPGSGPISGSGGPPPPPPAAQFGWTVTVSMTGPATGAGTWALLFSDPSLGSFSASFPVTGSGVAPLDIVNSWATQIQMITANSLDLFVVSTTGDATPDAGSAQLIVQQTPFSGGTTTVTGNNGGPGSVGIAPWTGS